MKHSTPNPTKAQQKRFEALQEMGCICCRIEGLGINPPQIHHLVEGRKRLGHDFTIPLCPWHHEGYPHHGISESSMLYHYGPSLARNKRKFIETYGTERELLEKVNENLKEE